MFAQRTVQEIAVANYQVPPPEKFSFKPNEWLRWIRRFERMLKATGLDQKDGESQVNTLIYSMGEAADDIVVLFGITAGEAKQYDFVKGKFEAHFVVKGNVIFLKEPNLTREVNRIVSPWISSLQIYIVWLNTMNLEH